MQYSKEGLDRIVSLYTIDGTKDGCAVLINGKRFRSSSGKVVWASKAHAKISLANSLKWVVGYMTMDYLRSSGLDDKAARKHPDYINAWPNFLKWALDTGWIQIIELK